MQENCSLGSDETIMALSAFSGGVGRNGGTCGALNAALTMIGLALGKGKGREEDLTLNQYIGKVYNTFFQEIAKKLSKWKLRGHCKC